MLVVAGVALGVGAAVAIILSAPRVSRVERPPPDLATAPTTATVTEEVIRERYTFSGELSADAQPRALPSHGVVTGIPLRPGGVPRAGQPLLEINGRPVIGLNLPFPLWRDLEAGTVGKDVSVVQAALGEIGAYAGPIDGVYEDVTQAAVQTLYLQLGYAPESRGTSNTGAADRTGADDSTNRAGAPSRRADGPGTVLPAAEVVALGGGPWRLNLSGVTVGTVLDGQHSPSLVGAGTQLTVDDNGRLAELLADGSPRQLSLVVGDESTRASVTVVASRANGNGSSVAIRAGSGHLPRGTVAGSAVVRSTSKPVTSVPVTALRPTADGRTLVRAVIDGHAQDIPVRVGLRGDRLVEVHGRQLVAGLTVELG